MSRRHLVLMMAMMVFWEGEKLTDFSLREEYCFYISFLYPLSLVYVHGRKASFSLMLVSLHFHPDSCNLLMAVATSFLLETSCINAFFTWFNSWSRCSPLQIFKAWPISKLMIEFFCPRWWWQLACKYLSVCVGFLCVSLGFLVTTVYLGKVNSLSLSVPLGTGCLCQGNLHSLTKEVMEIRHSMTSYYQWVTYVSKPLIVRWLEWCMVLP